MTKVFIKFRIEGWLEVQNEDNYNDHGVSLSGLAYQFEEGNGICTLMKEVERTAKPLESSMDASTLDFFGMEEDY